MKTRNCLLALRRGLPLAVLGATILATGCKTPGAYSGPRYRPVPRHVPSAPVPSSIPRPPTPPSHDPTLYSDARLKSEVVSFDRGLEAVDSIRTVRFRYCEDNPLGLDGGSEQVGVLAQELESAVPEAVSMDASGYRIVDTRPVLWSAVNAIQQLKRENEELRKRLAALERQGSR